MVGWMRLRHTEPVDARAERDLLVIACTEHRGGELEFVFEVMAPGTSAAGLDHNCWQLRGLTVRVETNADELSVTHDGDRVELRYLVHDRPANLPIHFTLRTEV